MKQPKQTTQMRHELIEAIRVLWEADEAISRAKPNSPEERAADRRHSLQLERVKRLAAVYFKQPIRSVEDCLPYAYLFELMEEVPRAEDADVADHPFLLGSRSVAFFAINLLKGQGYPSLFDRRSEPEGLAS